MATDIANLTQKINDFETGLTDTLAALGTSEQTALTAAANADAVAAQFRSNGAIRFIYIDGAAGDDANDGLTAATAVKTWAAMAGLFESAKAAYVRLLTDIVVTTNETLHVPPPKIYFQGRNDADTDYLRRKITFENATNFAGFSGGFYTVAFYEIQTLEVDFVMNYSEPSGPFYNLHAAINFWAVSTAITRTGTGGPLINGLFTGHLFGSGLIIDPSAAGNILAGVGAGVDPNSINGISSNFTSL